MQKFNPQEFVNKQAKEIRKAVGNNRALIAVSGGVDSTTSAALTYRAIGENLLCVILDDAFMREGEAERVTQILSSSPLNLPVRILNVQERFLNALKGMRDAEEKRKAFRETFYKTLSETAEKEGCRFLVQGTIAADIVETTGGVKTQHNILAQIGIDPIQRYGYQVVEPVAALYKGQVREVARYLGIPSEMSERQPFPGPGLSVRVVGEIRSDKLNSLKKATTITEENLAKHQPEQYFAAVIDNSEKSQYSSLMRIQETAARFLNVPMESVSVRVFQDKATGVKAGERRYGDIVAITVKTANGDVHQSPIRDLVAIQENIIRENPSITRILYAVYEVEQKQPYVIAIRAIQTKDFLTARVSEIPWATLNQTAQEIIKACSNVSSVYYDVTPKPPATVEME
jgi:GMP synthase (glutamine-hydrolysing)